MGLNKSVHARESSKDSSGGDTSVIIRRVNDDDNENDVSIVNLNDSVDMMSVGGQSMAGLSDGSGGGVVKIRSGVSDGGSMYSASDVQVVGGTNAIEDMNTSMAGLSDMSMGEIDVQKLGYANDSMTDLSMASLGGDESMAGINDSAVRIP